MSKKTREELKAELASNKEELGVAKEELKAFEKANSLKKGEDHSANAKVGKKWTKLNDMVTKKTKAVEDARAAVTAAKPEAKTRETNYVYPKEIETAADKKKFRAKARAEKKKALKDAEKGTTGGDKKAKKPEAAAPVEETKKKKKKKVVEETED